MTSEIKEQLKQLHKIYCGEIPFQIEELPLSGSNRLYFRLQSENNKTIGVYNEDKKENEAFLYFSKYFTEKQLPVPEIYAENLEQNIYLQQDLGDLNLFTFHNQNRENKEKVTAIYKKVIDKLIEFQLKGGENLDFNKCYPRAKFDKCSMMWDLNYFKYYVLKLAQVPFDEQLLENDFNSFCDFLLKTNCDYFLYRDFQPRNIMLIEEEPYFIDYQGGRKGALQYDLASLLYSSKANLSEEIREELLEYYILKLSKYQEVNKDNFKQYFGAYAIIRIMQALGAYGFRGLYERKQHFINSFPLALNNLKTILEKYPFDLKVEELKNSLNQLINSSVLNKILNPPLTVKIFSFSYKKGIPTDTSGNGGGFVFDCRALPNPGRYKEYKKLTGRDKEVIEFFDKNTEIYDFLEDIYPITNRSVKRYCDRNFTNLQVSFGCTGGQHRSVFCAEQFTKHMKKNFPEVKVVLKHIEN